MMENDMKTTVLESDIDTDLTTPDLARPKKSTGRIVVCVFDFLFAVISLLCFGFAAFCYYDIASIKSAGELDFGAGLSVAILIIFAIAASIVVAICAIIGLVLFLVSRKAKKGVFRKISLVIFLYHVCATMLCIIAYLVLLYTMGTVGS